jgi:hypothetical protein
MASIPHFCRGGWISVISKEPSQLRWKRCKRQV